MAAAISPAAVLLFESKLYRSLLYESCIDSHGLYLSTLCVSTRFCVNSRELEQGEGIPSHIHENRIRYDELSLASASRQVIGLTCPFAYEKYGPMAAPISPAPVLLFESNLYRSLLYESFLFELKLYRACSKRHYYTSLASKRK